MRESNFAFPAQNRASVCISSQLYDRRALDTNSSLPLFNSLTHLTYLTATSPRIREIMTMDGGLERLVRLLHDFCLSPPPPENPAVLYGLLPPAHRAPRPAPALNPKAFDKHAAYRFSLAFQCVVNIGVRGSEPIRSRVVQAGTLDVVGCILEAWLANKGFAVGPSSSASGMPRESREQRVARRLAQAEQRSREQAAELALALERQQLARQHGFDRAERRRLVRADDSGIEGDAQELDSDSMDLSMDTTLPDVSVSIGVDLSLSNFISPRTVPDRPSPAASLDTDADTSTDTSINATPAGSNTPTGTVEVPGRDRSGTIIARPVWDPATTHPPRRTHRARDRQGTVVLASTSTSTSANTSRPETETEEDDADVDMDRTATDASPSPEPMATLVARAQTSPHARRAVGIVSDTGAQTPAGGGGGVSLELNTDAHIIINHDQDVGGEGVGVEDGIVSLEPNDDFAMGAPPGAPGAIETTRTVRPTETARRARNDATPRAGNAALPLFATPGAAGGRTRRDVASDDDRQEDTPVRPNAPMQRNLPLPAVPRVTAPPVMLDTGVGVGAGAGVAGRHHHHHHHHHHPGEQDAGPYRDEDVLLSLQLLAYLSKYPHVRQAFYKPRASFHPVTASYKAGGRAAGVGAGASAAAGPSSVGARHEQGPAATSSSASASFFKTLAKRGTKGKEPAVQPPPFPNTSSVAANPQQQQQQQQQQDGTAPPAVRQTNVFSLVERFTFRPSSSESDLPNPPPTLPQEIQYWAGVIMRNACRKDDSRGGIRQCANMLCGRWESYPREFAKCRRCRKAKYCGKECQSTAWSEGHRFWCSSKDEDEAENAPAPPHPEDAPRRVDAATATGPAADEDTVSGGATAVGLGLGRRAERVRERVMATVGVGANTAEVARAVANVIRQLPPGITPRPGARAVVGVGGVTTAREGAAAAAATTAAEVEEAWGTARNPGWGRAFYEASPFVGTDERAGREAYFIPFQRRRADPADAPAAAATTVRRRAETMPGGMVPVVDGPSRTTGTTTTTTATVERSRFFNAPAPAGAGGGRADVSMIAGPSRVVREDDGEVYGLVAGDDISMDVD